MVVGCDLTNERKGVTVMSFYDDDDDFEGNESEGIKQLRSAQKAATKRIKELESELDSFRSTERTRSVSDVLAARGLNSKIADLIPSDLRGSDDINRWLDERADVFAGGTNRLATLISAIGVSIALAEVMRLLTDSRPVGSPRVLEKIILTEVWGANIRLDTVITIIAAAVIYFILERFIKLSRMGKAIRAVSQNEDAAKLMGVNLNRVITVTFLIGGLATGAAAFFYVTVFEYTKFNIGFTMGLAAFTAAVLGGIGNIRGAFWGGLSLGLLEVYASAVLGTQWKAVTVFVVLVLVLLFKPNGLFGEAVQQTRA